MVSKAFQVLSDKGLREVYDMNPTIDPTQRGGGGGGGGMARGFPGGGMRFQGHPGFQQEMNPEDLFNMFFGGGMDQGFGGPFGGARGEYSPHAHHPTSPHERPPEWQAHPDPQHWRHPEPPFESPEWHGRPPEWYPAHQPQSFLGHTGWTHLPSTLGDPRWLRDYTQRPPFPRWAVPLSERYAHGPGYCGVRDCYICA